MVTRVLTVGILAGVLAGLLVSLLQAYTTTPLISAAERFESAAATHDFGDEGKNEARLVVGQSGHAHANSLGSWAPAVTERVFYTSVATIGTAVGFALTLMAGMLAAGDEITEQVAIGWGAAGFASAGLAPALGLSPELPGMVSADLLQRQQWWLTTCTMTAIALWLFLRGKRPELRFVALLFLLAPHMWGAPDLPDSAGGFPAELAASFAATSLVVQAVLWIATSFFIGALWPRIGGADSRSGLQ